MTDENDKTDHKVPRFDHLNKLLSRDTRIKTYLQAFKCAALAKFGTKGSVLFLPLYNTKPGEIPSYLHFVRAHNLLHIKKDNENSKLQKNWVRFQTESQPGKSQSSTGKWHIIDEHGT